MRADLLIQAAGLASAGALVLGFAALCADRFATLLGLARAHLIATALGLALVACEPAGALRAMPLALAAAIGLAGAAVAGPALLPLQARAGTAPRAGGGRIAGLVARLAGGVLLAILAVRLFGAAGEAGSLGAANALAGLVIALPGGCRIGSIARVAMFGDGIALAASGLPDVPPVTAPAAMLIAPVLVGLAHASLGRAGGLPTTVR